MAIHLPLDPGAQLDELLDVAQGQRTTAHTFGVLSFLEPGSEAWWGQVPAFVAAFSPEEQATFYLVAPGRDRETLATHIRIALRTDVVPPHLKLITEAVSPEELYRLLGECQVFLDDASSAWAMHARARGLQVLKNPTPEAFHQARERQETLIGMETVLTELAAFLEISREAAEEHLQTSDAVLFTQVRHHYASSAGRIERHRVLYLADQLRRQRGRVRVLDLAGGVLAHGLDLAELPGVELSVVAGASEAQRFARWRAERHGLAIQWLDAAEPASSATNSYDVILALGTLEDPGSAAEALALLSEGGVLMLAATNAGHVEATGLEKLLEASSAVLRKPHAPKSGPLQAPFSHVLLLFTEHVYTTAKYFRKAFAELGFEVSVAGPGQGAVGGIELPQNADVAALIEAIAPERRPDLVIYVDVNASPQFRPCGFDRLGIPTVGYFIDSHMRLPEHLAYAGHFDHVAVSHGQYLPEFHAQGIQQAFWLPCAADPDVYRPMSGAQRTHQVVFVGNSKNHGCRLQLLEALAERFDLNATNAYFEACAEVYARSHVVFNCSFNGDLNMRVFETLAAGAALVTDRLDPAAGLEEFFRDGEHLLLYTTEEECFEAVQSLLDDSERAARIRTHARQAILAAHTYRHRALAILARVYTIPTRGAWMLAGERRFAKFELPAAIDAFNQALQMGGATPALCNNLGVCAHALDDHQVARQWFTAALELDPTYLAARENLNALGAPEPAAMAPAVSPPAPVSAVSAPDSPLASSVADYYQHPREEVMRLVPPTARRVLDVGCGAGTLGEALKQGHPEREYVGVEIDTLAAIHAAKRLDAVFQGSIDAITLPFPAGYFDCMIFADVLEHLPDPEATLARLLPLLKEGGHVVLSLPNVRHYTVLGDLFYNGKFSYQDAGILDRTHLRFYTYHEITEWMARAGLNLVELDANAAVMQPQFIEEMAKAIDAIGSDGAAFKQEGAVVQYLLRLEKPAAGVPVVKGARRELLGLPAAPRSEVPVASIVILTLNQLHYTRECLDSVLAYSSLPFEVIVIDNASTDGTRTYLRELAGRDPRVKVHYNAQNMGFGHGCNQGIAMSRGELIVLLNNDTVVTEGWLEGLIKPMLRDATIGAVGPRSNQVSGPQVLNYVPYGSNMDEMQRFARWLAETHRDQGIFVPRIIGFCFAVRRSVLEKIGGFDTRFAVGNFEDDDLSLRVNTAGFRIWISQDVFIHHYGHATFRGEGMDFRSLMGENWERFATKWGLDPRAHTTSYPGQQLSRLPFDPARDVSPILVPEAPPAHIEGAKGFHFLSMPDWRDMGPVVAAIAAFDRAFTASDDVALLLWVDPSGKHTTQEVAEELGRRLHERGIGGENSAELVLFDAPGDPLQIGHVFTTAQVCLPLGNAAIGRAAKACGLEVLDAVTAESLRMAAGLEASVTAQ